MACEFPIVPSAPARQWFLSEMVRGSVDTTDDWANGHFSVLLLLAPDTSEADPNLLGVHPSFFKTQMIFRGS